jgi:hypothetical protein
MNSKKYSNIKRKAQTICFDTHVAPLQPLKPLCKRRFVPFKGRGDYMDHKQTSCRLETNYRAAFAVSTEDANIPGV